MTDAEIIDLFFERSEQAITELAKKHGGAVSRIAYNILGNMQDTEECVNDTWMGTWNAILPGIRAALAADPYQPSGEWFGKVFTGMTDRIESPNGPADWIAVNPDIVADHGGDMFNTFDTTLELVWDLVELYHFIENPEWAAMVPSGLPVYLISGDQDPCGNYGEGLYHVANLLAESGNRVSVKAYSGYRHEIHNELELRDEVEAGLISFAEGVLA